MGTMSKSAGVREALRMVDWSNAPALFFAPFVSSRMRVEQHWLDYNGHMNMAFYHVLFDRALDEAFTLIGLGPDYVASRNASYFAAEAHVRYHRELTEGCQVRATLQLIDFDDKRLHCYLELRHAQDGWLSASAELLSLHVDMASRKVTPFPPDILTNLALLKAAHARLKTPADLGRRIGLHAAQGVASPRLNASAETLDATLDATLAETVGATHH
jgi:acyl-CoA thioester hydrolase